MINTQITQIRDEIARIFNDSALPPAILLLIAQDVERQLQNITAKAIEKEQAQSEQAESQDENRPTKEVEK